MINVVTPHKYAIVFEVYRKVYSGKFLHKVDSLLADRNSKHVYTLFVIYNNGERLAFRYK